MKEVKKESLIASILNNIGLAYQNTADFPKALEAHLSALKIRRQTNDTYGMAFSYNNIGNIFLEQTDYPKALEYYSNSIKFFKIILFFELFNAFKCC